jgi:hypothetical protein
MIGTLFIGLAAAAFCCLFAYQSSREGISGDWRKWGFDSDPLAPEPSPVGDLKSV